ncbi:putative cellulose synthase (UDP-forming) [Helianthus annuus]|nr:putative cellulose synthase (UDP-forming) [Helianthus annuus]
MLNFVSCLLNDVGLHARTVSTVLTVDSDMIDEGGNPIWKNRVESWKDKKKKRGGKVAKEVQVPVDQHIEEKQQSADPNAMQPLSQIIPIPKSQIAPCRTVVILRLIILGLFFQY